MNFYFQTTSESEYAFGFGQTEKTYIERQKNSDYTKVVTKDILFGHAQWRDQNFWVGYSYRDTEVHEWLRGIPGITQATNPETGRYLEGFNIDLNSGLNNIIVEKWIHNRYFATKGFEDKVVITKEPRIHQAEFLIKIASAWEKYKEFLLFAKCRAGKTSMTYFHISQYGHKTTVVLCRQLSPEDGWAEDIKGFDDLEYITYTSDISIESLQSQVETLHSMGKKVVIFSTVQTFIKVSAEFVDIDLLVYDEAHLGTKSVDSNSQWNLLKRSLDCKKLYLSGTAYQIMDNFQDDQRYIFSYYEEQMLKKSNKADWTIPTMSLYCIDINFLRTSIYDKGEVDKFTNMFHLNEDRTQFRAPNTVSKFIDWLFGRLTTSNDNEPILEKSEHIYIKVSGEKQCAIIANLVTDRYNQGLSVTSSQNINPTQINEFIKSCDETDKRAVVITDTANILGVTTKLVDTAINLTSGMSIDDWVQFGFRAGSSNKDFKVIDLYPERMLSITRKMHKVATDLNPSISQFNYEDFHPIYQMADGVKQLDENAIYEALSTNIKGGPLTQMGKVMGAIDLDAICNIDFGLYFDGGNNSTNEMRVVNSSGTNNDSSVSRTNEKKKPVDGETEMKMKTLRAILERTPLSMYHYINRTQPTSLERSAYTSSPEYIDITGDNHGLLVSCINEGVIDRIVLNEAFETIFIQIKNLSNIHGDETLNQLAHTCSSQLPIPANILLNMAI